MSHALVIANIDRAAGHAAVLGVLVGVTAVGGLIYWLIRLAARSRARSTRGPGTDHRPDA